MGGGFVGTSPSAVKQLLHSAMLGEVTSKGLWELETIRWEKGWLGQGNLGL